MPCSLASTATGYYVKDRALEPAGYWMGHGAEEFGLSGEVQAEHLTRLCEGFDPHTGEKLVRNAGVTEGPRARRHGFDLCFSAPKSVSVCWALATGELREEIQKAVHHAVRDALEYISEHAGLARVGTNGQKLAQVPLIFVSSTAKSPMSWKGRPSSPTRSVRANRSVFAATSQSARRASAPASR